MDEPDLSPDEELEARLERQEKAVILAAEREDDLRNAFSQLFASPNGELVLGYLADRFRFYKPLSDGDEDASAELIARRDGERTVVIEIWERAHALSLQKPLPLRLEEPT